MCRLSAFISLNPICAADLVTRPSRSIITQSFDARERMTGDASTPAYLNGDGFGIGWYAEDRQKDPTPCIYKQSKPAWNDTNISPISDKVNTPLLFAHVRASSETMDSTEAACHPFRCGQFLFMHNGGVGGFAKVRRKLMAMLDDDSFAFAVKNSSSDTAVCFGLFLTLLKDKKQQLSSDGIRRKLEEMIAILEKTVNEADVEEVSLLNFVVSDGFTLVATRYAVNPKAPENKVCASLYIAAGNEYKQDPQGPTGLYRMVHKDRRPTLAIVSSEPLTDNRTDWIPVPINHAIVITPTIHILLSPIQSGSYIGNALENLTSMTTLKSSLRRTRRTGERHSRSLSRSLESSSSMDSSSTEDSDIKVAHNALRYTLEERGGAVLTLVVYNQHLFSGTQDGRVCVWNIADQCSVAELDGHNAGVLALHIDKNNGLLLSASADSIVCVWFMDPQRRKFERLQRFELAGKGQIFSLARIGKSVFAGFADTYVRCFNEEYLEHGKEKHRVLGGLNAEKRHLSHVFALTPCHHGKYLCSGSGDGLIRVWEISSGRCIRVLEGHKGGVLTLECVESDGSFLLFSGSRDTTVKVWDIDCDFACRRTIRAHKSEIVVVAAGDNKILTGSDDGRVNIWCIKSLECIASWKEASLRAAAIDIRENLVFTALRDRTIVARDMMLPPGDQSDPCSEPEEKSLEDTIDLETDRSSSVQIDSKRMRKGPKGKKVASITKRQVSVMPTTSRVSSERLLQDVLASFVSHKSVPGNEDYQEKCWRCAKFILTFLESLGANVHCVTSPDVSHNPLVFARFMSSKAEAPNVVFYGHYDVMPAAKEEWSSDPWTLTSKDGYFYGRGTTDDKGPICALAFAIKELMEDKEKGLNVNITLVLEGEGENSNIGFQETILRHMHWLENTDYILTSNSYWLGEDQPCITYGMRGVVDIDIVVSGPKINLHSGVDGGSTVEVLSDLVALLATLTDSAGKCCVPGFYENVRELTSEEEEMLANVAFDVPTYMERCGVEKLTADNRVDVLRSRWRQPSLSVSDITTSNAANTHSVVPRMAKACISCRFVPNQSAEEIESKLRTHIANRLRERKSPNSVEVKLVSSGDWWLEDPKLPANQVAEAAIKDVWGVPPLYVCEGGTMPMFSFLKEKLQAPILQIPMGQSSDNAHLPNERIRVTNLHNGKKVMKYVLQHLKRRTANNGSCPAPREPR